MNTKNGTLTEKENLSRLNKARAKSRKRPLREFYITRIKLPRRVAAAVGSSAASRQKAGQHYVAGHFKVRKSGVFWWTPFLRGDPERQLHREGYKVIG